eukprot:280131-Amphidinium_carterae.1
MSESAPVGQVPSEPQAAGAARSGVANTFLQGDSALSQTAGAAFQVLPMLKPHSGFLLSTQLSTGYAFMRHGIYLASVQDACEQDLSNFEVSFVRLLNTQKGTGYRKRSQAASLQRKWRRHEKRASATCINEQLSSPETAGADVEAGSADFGDALSSQASMCACSEYIEWLVLHSN